MRHSSNDYEFLGKQVAAGRYVARSTFALALVLALLTGAVLGRYVFPYEAATDGEKRPLGQQSQVAQAVNPNKQLLDSILQHEKEVSLDPGNLHAWETLGNLYYDVGDPAKSINAYNRALALQPDNTSVLVDCGVMYRVQGEHDKALEYFQKALAIDPKHEHALFNSGVVLFFDLNRKEDALNAWRELVRINPNAKTPSGELVSKLLQDIS